MKKKDILIIVGVLSFVFAGFYLLGKFKEGTDSTEQESLEKIELEKLQQAAQRAKENIEPSKTRWNVNSREDEMTDSENIWASIQSGNYITQDFPYEGETYATITVRYMKKYGYDVLIQISKGQIHGNGYNGTNYITARFDEGTPKKYYFNEANDGSSETVFIQNKMEFIKQCKQAKLIRIDIPLYKAGRPVFRFDVEEPLIWPK